MPNHIHCIVVNVGADLCVRHFKTTPSPLPAVVQWFKTMTTNEYIRGVRQSGWQPFPGKLWQRSYWEHVVRNDTELTHLREYIQNNPAKWALDTLNPAARVKR